jgi:hypothetical protein
VLKRITYDKHTEKDLFNFRKSVVLSRLIVFNRDAYYDCRTRDEHHVGPTYRSVDGTGIAAGTDGAPTAA